MTAPVPTVGVVVPTRNSQRTLATCLHSLQAQRYRPTIVVVDNHSTDSTLAIAGELADRVLVAGPERSSQRNRGAELLGTVDVVGFVDSDMVVDPDVIAEVATLIAAGADAVVVPEQTLGSGFVARVRRFERAQYVGRSHVEAARFFRRSLFDAVGGFDEELNAGEDWDLALRVEATGATTSHATACIWHDEEAVGFFAHCAKKGRYAVGLRQFLAKHGEVGRGVLLDRPYLRHPWSLFRHPVLGLGLVMLKGGEVIAVTATLVRGRVLGRRTSQARVGGPSVSSTPGAP